MSREVALEYRDLRIINIKAEHRRNELAEPRSFIWDRDIERDAASGQIDQFANEAIEEYRTGKLGPL